MDPTQQLVWAPRATTVREFHQPPTGLAAGPPPQPLRRQIFHRSDRIVASIYVTFICPSISGTIHKPEFQRGKKVLKIRKKMAENVKTKENQPARHQEVGHKSLLQSDALYQVT